MATLSDVIERHLNLMLRQAENGVVEIRRGEVAQRFQCVPSQVNYVLETRFRVEQGYIIESRRGGGGYIRITKVPARGPVRLLQHMQGQLGSAGLAAREAWGYLQRLAECGIITARERDLLGSALAAGPFTDRNVVAEKDRASLFESLLRTLMRYQR